MTTSSEWIKRARAGATVAVIYTNIATGAIATDRSTIHSLKGDIVTLDTGETFSTRTLERTSNHQRLTFARIADPNSPEIIQKFAKQDQDEQRRKIRDAYTTFHCEHDDNSAARLIGEIETFRELLAAASPAITFITPAAEPDAIETKAA